MRLAVTGGMSYVFETSEKKLSVSSRFNVVELVATLQAVALLRVKLAFLAILTEPPVLS